MGAPAYEEPSRSCPAILLKQQQQDVDGPNAALMLSGPLFTHKAVVAGLRRSRLLVHHLLEPFFFFTIEWK